MIALMILSVLVIYIAVAWFIVKYLPSKTAKWFAIVVFVLIPAWDIVSGYIYFYSVCATESGQKIYKTVKLPSEYFLKTGDPDRSKADIGGIFPKAVGGELNREKLSERYLNQNEFDRSYSKLFHITKVHSYVEDKQTKEILGTATSFIYKWGWVVNLHEFPPSKWCPNSPTDPNYIHSTLLENIFKPAMQSSSVKGD